MAKKLEWHLKELRLPVIRTCFEETARRAEKEAFSYQNYLLDLVMREQEGRRRNRIQNWLRESDLPVSKSLARFNLKRIPLKVSRQVRTLLEGTFLDRAENLLIFGNPGSRKSYLLCAIAQELLLSYIDKSRDVRLHCVSTLRAVLCSQDGLDRRFLVPAAFTTRRWRPAPYTARGSVSR